MILGGLGSLRRMGELDRTVTVDPIVVNGQTTAELGSVISGNKPPLIPGSWWPWLIAAGALGLAWYISNKEEGDADDDRPFDE